VRHLSLGTGGVQSAESLRRVPGRLTALQHVEVRRTIDVAADGNAGAFSLLLTTQHERASDLLLRLVAPTGVAAELAVPQPRADQQDLIFTARPGSALAALSAEDVRGTWELVLVDRRSGEIGELINWGLRFPGGAFDDAPEQGISLPDPVRTEQVEILLADNGRQALAVPTRAGVAGAVSVWDLDRGELAANLPVQSAPEQVNLLSQTGRAVIVADNRLAIFDLGDGRSLADFELGGRLALSPAISMDERHMRRRSRETRWQPPLAQDAAGAETARNRDYFPGCGSAGLVPEPA
jgi:subtilisin-like proprotein convertase family protein